MDVRIRKGLDLPIAGQPRQVVSDPITIHSVALMANDYIGVKPDLRVAQGDRVSLGQPLFEDRDSPGVLFTSPACGTVSAIHYGVRHDLQAVVVQQQGRDQKDQIAFDAWTSKELESLDAEMVRRNLLASGLWTALRARPFGRVPHAASTPDAIFVTVIDTNPLAPDPKVVVDASPDAFVDGVQVIGKLTQGKIHVCFAPGSDPHLAADDRICLDTFTGPHPAGLVGTHIHFLEPLSNGKTVWHLNYQDVIAIGRLFTSGQLDVTRTVAIAGPQVTDPRLVQIPLGASIDDLVEGELQVGASRVISGSVLSGRRVSGWGAYLGRYHLQVSALSDVHRREFLGWLRPGRRLFSASRLYVSSFLKKRQFNLSTAQHGSRRAMVPIGSYEKVMPLDLVVTPLLKALLVGDTETARALGCLELDEEDLALCSFVCCSKYEFGAALRETLSLIEKSG